MTDAEVPMSDVDDVTRPLLPVASVYANSEGAAFEYTFNVEHELRMRGLRERAKINEFELGDFGDFGVCGMSFKQNGFVTTSQLWTESVFKERGVKALSKAHVQKVEEGRLCYETLDGDEEALNFDFAMLLPHFRWRGPAGVRWPGR